MKSPVPCRATALVIVLAFVVLLTATVVAFLTRAQIGVQYSQTSASGTRADAFCRGAIDQVVGDLKQEIAAGSTIVRDANGMPKVYVPINASGQRQNLLPYPVNASSTSLSLVKESLPAPFYASAGSSMYDTAGYPAPNRASASVSTSPSANSRLVSLKRWNKPLLLPGTSGDDDTPPGGTFTAPNWVYVARDGSNPGGGGVAVSSASYGPWADQTSATFVLGRYAYTVYDEAALLDVNAAGYPSGTSPGQINAKGSLGLADLTQLGLSQSTVDALVGWRNYASAQSVGSFPAYGFSGTAGATSYYNLLMGISGGALLPTPVSGTSTAWEGVRKTGFLTVANQNLSHGQSDRLFSTRQELIRMLVHDLAKNTADRAQMKTALQSLGTFSRTLNAPSWLPVTPKPPAANTTSAIDYGANAIKQAQGLTLPSTPANQIAPAVLVKTQFVRDDGTTARVGDPLVKYRFPLRRLEWFNAANASQTTYAAAIKQWFCLAPSTSAETGQAGTWNYVDPDTKVMATAPPVIKTLDQVASAGREPTFWEMLQAAILSGSLGDGTAGDHIFNTSNDTVPVRHLLQVGVNIIDQYNSNSAPTAITFGSVAGMGQNAVTPPLLSSIPITGIKNLPYIALMMEQDFPTAAPSTPAPTGGYTYNGYMQFLLWNPHYNAANMTTANGGGSGGSLNFRLVTSGIHQLGMFPVYGGTYTPYITGNNEKYAYGSTTTSGANANAIAFSAGGTRFSNVDVLTPSDAPSAAGPLVYSSGGTATQVGFFMGQFKYTSNPPVDPTAGPLQIWDNPPPSATNATLCYRLEVQAGGTNGAWIPYQVFGDWDDQGTVSNLNSPGFSALTTYMNTLITPRASPAKFTGQLAYVFSDPRTIRFGTSDTNGAGATLKSSGWSIVDGSGKPIQTGTGRLANFTPDTNSGYGFLARPGGWAYNLPTASTNYPQYYSSNLFTSSGVSMGGDAVVRQGDANVNLPVSTGHPLFNAGTPGVNAPARPYFLGRSFNSVAEMGYAGRDEPWKTVNFYSSDSADGALLDYFSLSETSAQAGGVNVNTASASALAAMLSGAYTDANDPTSGLSAAEATSIAKALRGYLGANHTNVAFDPSDIPTLAAQVAKASAFPAARTVPATLKRAQEVVARALSDSWNTRTWNLLIDVVAQTGRLIPAGASKTKPLDQFVADGERRVWAHVAIDRFTGQVVDVQLEPVTE